MCGRRGGGGGVPAQFNSGNDGGDGNYGGGGGGAGQGGIAGGKGGFGGGGGALATGGFGGGGGQLRNGGLFGGNNSGGGAALGGAIFNEGGSVIVRNSTFFNNFVDRGTSSIGSNGADAGGAIFSLNGSLTVLNATISGNTSTGSAGGIEVFATSTASLNLYNTIIFNNGVNECVGDETSSGQVLSAGLGNLIGFGPTCNVTTVFPGGDPLLGPLQNNLGLTPTMAIPRTSAAFNKADPATSLPSDQRGQTRPAQGMGGVPDIGAFELCLTGTRIAPMPCIISAGNGGTPMPLTIQTSPPAGGTTSPAPGTHNETPNSVVLLTATPNPGYALANWTGPVADPHSLSTAVIMDQAQTVTANFVGVPVLNITKTHLGNFTRGQPNATYALTVSNSGAGATNGTVTVSDTLPPSLVLTSLTGTGWNCSSNMCMRSDALAPGASYPVITVTVGVQFNAPSPQVNQVKVSGGGSVSAIASDSTVITMGPTSTPTLSVTRTQLNFGYSGALLTSPQTVTVNITGAANVGWTVSSDHPNVTLSPASGTGSGTFQVTATPPSGGGSSNAVITVTAGGATGSPQQIQVSVNSVVPAAPFGSFDTPTNNLTGIAGAIGVTGWALDNIEITNVRIYREPPPGQRGPLAFIGHAVFVADARPDVAATFPGSPYQYRAGWGYLMLTNFLPNGSGSGPLGNGTYNIHALATNANGTVTDLGTRTITVDNAHASKPFGTIDTPAQGGTATGSGFVNYGWALTQNPFIIPTDGSTITVFLDGTPTGHPTYNQFRSDIATLFPGYLNSNGAVGYFFIDTTKLQNKVHTINWSVTDNGGRVDGIGSRYFSVFNTGGGVVAAPEEPPTPESLAGPVQLRSGYDLKAPNIELAPDDTGAYSVKMEQFDRIELSLGATKGDQIVGDEAAELPLGSTLKAGVFYWQPPLGFFGKYELLFEREDGSQVRVRVSIVPKQYILH
jgi:hypothetical protein